MSASVHDIVRRHIRLPVNTQLGALKQVLYDWVDYTEHTQLQAKPQFPAHLLVEVRRPPPPARPSSVEQKKIAHVLSDVVLQPHTPRDAGHVHRKYVPLKLWTALLPWEVQRGLSCSTLRHATSRGDTVGAEATTESSREDSDPYGVVRGPATSGGTAAPSPQSAAAAAAGMMFVLNVEQVRSHGLGFWSGAITQPIDVLFIAAVLPPGVAQSPSLARLYKREQRALAADHAIVADVLRRYFPLHEMQSSVAELHVHAYGHLDPFKDAKRTPSVGGCHSMEVPTHPGEEEGVVPHYVLETERHVMRESTQAALKESAASFQQRYGTAASTAPDDVELYIKLELSQALKDDLLAKAQLAVNYVQPLEACITQHLRQLNAPESLAPDARHVNIPKQPGASSSDEPRMQVWLSEHESRWMTAAELAQLRERQTKMHQQTPQDAQREEEEASAETTARTDHYDGQDRRAAYDGSAENRGEDADDDDDAAFMALSDTAATADAVEGDDSSSLSLPATGAPRHNVTQPGTTSRMHGIARQSPMLVEEADARPAHLAPSFTGRHEAAALRKYQVQSASALARLPRTHSHMPVLPAIDYELFDLCLRLGVGQESVIFYYHGRMMREWRQELRRLLKAGRGDSEAPLVSKDDVRRMLQVVRDPALQVPEELASLVEAVAARRLP